MTAMKATEGAIAEATRVARTSLPMGPASAILDVVDGYRFLEARVAELDKALEEANQPKRLDVAELGRAMQSLGQQMVDEQRKVMASVSVSACPKCGQAHEVIDTPGFSACPAPVPRPSEAPTLAEEYGLVSTSAATIDHGTTSHQAHVICLRCTPPPRTNEALPNPNDVLRKVRRVLEECDGGVHSTFGAIAAIKDHLGACSDKPPPAPRAQSHAAQAARQFVLEHSSRMQLGDQRQVVDALEMLLMAAYSEATHDVMDRASPRPETAQTAQTARYCYADDDTGRFYVRTLDGESVATCSTEAQARMIVAALDAVQKRENA